MMIGIGAGLGFAGSVQLWTPLSVAPLLWLRADRGITLNGGNVAQWSDLSASANHFTQATAGNQPAYNSGALPSVELTLNTALDSTASLDLTGSYSALFVYEWVTTVTGKFAIVGAGATRPQLYTVDDGSKSYWSHSGAFANPDRPASGIEVMDADYDGSSEIRARINGGAYWTKATGDLTTAALGLGYVGYSSCVKLYEICFITPKLSATDQARLTAYARGRYGV